MSLSNKYFRAIYNSREHNLSEEFYSYALSSACRYYRISAYFSSSILAAYGNGLEHLYDTDGKIRYIFSHGITKHDYDLMVQGYKSLAENGLKDKLDFASLEPEEKSLLFNLAFLIESGIIEIKIAYSPVGIMHLKKGLSMMKIIT
ncbi:MAG: hypothetical protein ACK5HS_05385 [Mycoplasmatales bacterium]